MRVEYRKGASPEVWADLAPESVAAIVTDPPYGTGKPSAIYGRRVEGKASSIANDADLSQLGLALPEMVRVLARFGVALVFAAPSQRSQVERMVSDAGLRVDGFAPWDKGRPGISYSVRYAYEEMVIASHFGTDSPFESRDPLVVPLRCPPVKDTEHPNEKPVALLRRYIRWALPNEKGLILDPFAGIASCGVAAVAEGCDYIGAECDPQWWPIAERRLAEVQNRPHDDLPQNSLFDDTEAA